MTRRTTILGVAAGALLALPGAATAAPHRPGPHGPVNAARVFPVASGLCKHVLAGHLPKKLQPVAGQLTTDCNQLQTAFTAAQSTFQSGVSGLRPQAQAAVQQAKQTCQQARANHDLASCKAAIQQARSTVQGLMAQAKSAAQAFRAAVNAARQAFWSSVRSLRGAAGLPQDKPVSSTPATPDLSSDATAVSGS